MNRMRAFLVTAVLAACAASPVPTAVAAAAAERVTPTPAPARLNFATSCGIPRLRETILQRVNAARAAGKSCGGKRMPRAPPLAWNDTLFSAAARHSGDMARRNYFDHATPEGKQVGVRVTAEGYSWRAVGENIAGGERTADGVMRRWLASEGHCRNIMNPEFNEIGAACVERGSSTWGAYWTMVLGRRR
jgi:uncharacterized protein YkwD